MAESIPCPFCAFSSPVPYAVLLHVEERHTDDSPFVPASPAPASSGLASKHASSSTSSSTPSSDGEDYPWIKCTRPKCGLELASADLDDHYRLHAEQDRLAVEDEQSSTKSGKRPASKRDSGIGRPASNPPKLQRAPRSESTTTTSSKSSSHSLLHWFSGSSTVGGQKAPSRQPQYRHFREPRTPGRLGRRELGPHAFEKRMPEDVRQCLIRDAKPTVTNRIGNDGRLYREAYFEHETANLIPVLADLCAIIPSTRATYLCHPSVRHVAMIRCDGNFCGYWSIQMVCTYLDYTRPGPDGRRRPPLPNVLAIQDTIETAWENGICAWGRTETGGVRNTRKWIGTHEALAYFTEVGVEVEAIAFNATTKKTDRTTQAPVMAMLDHVEAFYMSALDHPETRHHRTSHITPLPPIYFQRFGHSMTIVGLERKADGSRNLLVFDSSFPTTATMDRFSNYKATHAYPDAIMAPYRRSDLNLSRYDEFELIVPKVSLAMTEEDDR